MSSEYHASFFIVPIRIMNLPDIQLSYVRIYETIFQFWNHGKNCYLSNSAIMERTGIKSDSTIREAFIFFEKYGELIRRKKGGKRYLVQPERTIEIDSPVDKSKIDSIKTIHTVAKSTPNRRQVDAPTVAKSTHNNKKLKEKNLIREREPLSLFEPDEKNKALCHDFKLNLNEEVESFINRCKWKMTQYNFGRWLKLSSEYRIKKGMDDYSGKKSSGDPYSAANRMKEFISERNIIRSNSHGSEISRNNAGRANL